MNGVHEEERGFRFGHVVLAALTGAVAGAAAAYLTAPRPGAETRRRLQATAEDARGAVGRVPIAVRRATEAARDAFTEAIARDHDAA